MTVWLPMLAQPDDSYGELYYLIALLIIAAVSAIAEKVKRGRDERSQQKSSPKPKQEVSLPKPPTLEPPEPSRPPARPARPVPPPMRRPIRRPPPASAPPSAPPPPVVVPPPVAQPRPSVQPRAEEEVVVWTPLVVESKSKPAPEPRVPPRRRAVKPEPAAKKAVKPVPAPRRGPIWARSVRGLSKREIRRAIVLREILGPPIALREDEQYPAT